MTSDQSPIINLKEARYVDEIAVRELGLSSLMLMENAARGIAEVIRQHFSDATSIHIACGFGNNGGDGLALTRLLAAEGISSSAYLIDNERSLSDDAQQNLKFLEACEVPLIADSHGQQFQNAICDLPAEALIVDGLLGTGIQGDPKSPYDSVISSINESAARVLAVDIPSGLNADTGQPGNPTIKAHHTVTFVGLKTGFECQSARSFTGPISVAHIGLPVKWIQSFLKRTSDSEDQ